MDFEVLKTEHFDIYFYPEEREAAVLAGQMSERWRQRLSGILGEDLPDHQPVIMYDSAPAFRQTTVLPGEIGVGTGGVTEGLKRRVILPFAGSLAETDHVLGHELVHAYQYYMTSGPNAATPGVPGAATLPLWFIEGMAEYLSVGPVDPHTAMWLRDAVAREKLPSLSQLDDPEYFPYRFGQAFWAYIGRTYGDAVVGEMLRAAGAVGSPQGAIREVLAIEPSLLVEQWHTVLIDAYQPVLDATSAPATQARVILDAEEGRSLNVSPSISPDGKHLVVFSERNLFSIEMFLVDPATGEFRRKITNTATDAHFDSLEFIYSSGAWSADSTRFAFASLNTGRPVIGIYDVNDDRIIQTLEVPDVGEIFHLSWHPSGDQIAFTAIQGGTTDLFLADVASSQITRLSDDAFVELYPSWSPSGRYIALSTDRFGTQLQELGYGNLKLGLYDTQTRQFTELSTFPSGKSIDPHWGTDDDTLFFVSDRTGISNVYRWSRSAGSAVQLTDVQTGVTGIAAHSPAITVAPASGQLLFSTFSEGDYSIYAIETGAATRDSALEYERVATLPPLVPTENAQEEFVSRVRATLPAQSSFATEDYRPKLGLDYVAPPSISAGVGSYGAAVGGGTAFYWSDMLEQHQLMTSFQTMSTSTSNILRSIGAMAAYENRSSRWTWGLIGGQSPYQTGGYDVNLVTIDDAPVAIEDNITYWQIERQMTGLAAYPFSRATRVEFTTGYRNIGFAAETQRSAYDAVTGQFLGSTTQDLDTPSGLHMGAASAALVHDTAVVGPLNPMAGMRYRMEFGGQSGSVNFTTGLADFRRYIRLPGNLTLAGRIMHFGRYGGGAEDSRLQDISIGYPSLLRGYNLNSFSASECGPALQQTGACPAFEQLFGSRMAVANAELRIPVLGALGLIPSRYVPPVEISPFFDAGVAWRSNERTPFLQSNARKPVRSYGGSMRASVLGYFIAQISYVRPMDRPRGWHWEFSITPGF